MHALRGSGVKAKAYIFCFYDVILLFKSVQGGKGCLKITKFERTYFMDGPPIHIKKLKYVKRIQQKNMNPKHSLIMIKQNP